VMPTTDAVKVVERQYSNRFRLEWWAKEGSARNDHERRADQYDRKSGIVFPQNPVRDSRLIEGPRGRVGALRIIGF